MKHYFKIILLSSLLFCLSFINIASAKTYVFPTNQEQNPNSYFSINIPDSWRIETYSKPSKFFSASFYSPTHFPVIGTVVGPHVDNKQSNNVNHPDNNKSKYVETTTIEQSESELNGYKAKILVTHITNHAQFNNYSLICFIPTEHNDFLFTMQGLYKNYEEDRKIFNEFASTLNLNYQNLSTD